MTNLISESEPSFIVYIRTTDEIEIVRRKLETEFQDIEINWRGFTETSQNWISFSKNPHYDPRRVDDMWFLNRFMIEVMAKPTVDADSQNSLAKRIMDGLVNVGYEYELVN